jgi:proteasome accessory factor B
VLALLDTPRPLSLREIGGAVAGYPSEPGALRQAFERDKRTLREGGIPVSTERIGGDEQVGYRILPEHYYLPDLHLDTEEEEALAFAVAAVRIEGGVGRDVLAKLGSPGLAELPPVAVLPSLPALGPLQQAVRGRALVSFTYRDKAREVEPYGLLFRSGAWYLVGRDRSAGDGGDLRTFRVDRLEGAPVLGESDAFALPEGFDAAAELRFTPWASPPAAADGAAAPRDDAAGEGTEAREVLVEVDVREARAALSLAGSGALESKGDDGSVRLRFRVGDEAAFVAWALGCGDAVEVLEPSDLRERVVGALVAAAGSPSVALASAATDLDGRGEQVSR